MSDAAGLLAAIRAAPDDDAPRLIYADWLDEHGQPERAEFIRIQCELARNDSQSLREREAALLAEHRAEFEGQLASPHIEFVFHRGFIARFGHLGRFASGTAPIPGYAFASWRFSRDGRFEWEQITDIGLRWQEDGSYSIDPFDSPSRLLIKTFTKWSPQRMKGVLEGTCFYLEGPDRDATRDRWTDRLFGRRRSSEDLTELVIRAEYWLVHE